MRTEELADARADLAWIASTLSRLRDLEVVENRIQHLASRSTHAGSVDDATAAPTSVEQAAAWVVPQLQGEREQAWTEALDEIGGEQWRDALERLARLANDPPTRHRADRPADTVLPRLVGRQYAALSTRAASVRADGDDADWHRVRITAKHARNAAELAVPVVGSDARRLAKRLNTITDLLGELQDTVLVRGTLMGAAHGAARSDAGPDVDPVAAGFGLGLLHAQEVQAATRLRTAFPAAWAEADRKRYRRWLGA
jgi:CHAD domain-containing protein